MRAAHTGVLLASLVVLACAGARGAAGPRLVAVGPGADCVSLGSVAGEGSGGSLVTYETQVDWATQQALGVANGMGATHVVLDHEDKPGVTLWVSGTAYRCP
jgi:hypothetical protein